MTARVLTSPDHEDRVRRYAAMVAAGRRLFEDGPAPPADRHGNLSRRCLGCDAPCRFFAVGGPPDGWETRRRYEAGVELIEIHCPACVRAWGWGDMG